MQIDPDDPGVDERADAIGHMVREVRQRLESLHRAGVREIPFVAIPARKRPEAPAVAGAATMEMAAAPSRVEPPARPAATPPSPPPPPPSARIEPAPAPAPAPPPPIASRPPTSTSSTSLFEAGEFETPALAPASRLAVLRDMAAEVAACRKCAELASTRTQTVFADGSPTARLMFIGEAPGADEDRTGLPFVGRAGQLLTDMITKGMGLKREEVYIANILKCRPPENRPPAPDESANCIHFLERQIEIVRPEFLCLLGRTAAVGVLNTSLSMGRLRGKWYRYRGIPTIATYHPSYLLRTPSAKKETWEDLQLLMTAMGLRIPARPKGQP